MSFMIPTPTFVLVTLITSRTYVPTPIFIEAIPEYWSLNDCAVVPLSIIVRGMKRGCNDNLRTTSYGCFCSTSSSFYNSLISSEVSLSCEQSAQHTSAMSIFERYCEIGQMSTSAAFPDLIFMCCHDGIEIYLWTCSRNNRCLDEHDFFPFDNGFCVCPACDYNTRTGTDSSTKNHD